MKSATVRYTRRVRGVTSTYVPPATVVSGRPAALSPSIWAESVAVIAYSNLPPGRSSSLRTFVTNPSGPHHDSRPAFVVQRSQTSSTAAARKVRSKVSFALGEVADVGDLLFLAISLTSSLRGPNGES